MANRGRWAHIGPKFGALTPSNAMVAWETQATGYERCRDCTRCHLRSAREPSVCPHASNGDRGDPEAAVAAKP